MVKLFVILAYFIRGDDFHLLCWSNSVGVELTLLNELNMCNLYMGKVLSLSSYVNSLWFKGHTAREEIKLGVTFGVWHMCPLPPYPLATRTFTLALQSCYRWTGFETHILLGL